MSTYFIIIGDIIIDCFYVIIVIGVKTDMKFIKWVK